MDKPKTELVKSKSISTSVNKSYNHKHDKKSRSNAELKPLVVKKRGVYVEKKPVTIGNRDLSPEVLAKKSTPLRPSPRLGRERFLASVLSILSKSTTGTQCPEGTAGLDELDKLENAIKVLKRRRYEEKNKRSISPFKRKNRYSFKVLSSYEEQDTLPAVQTTEELTRKPPNYSVKCNDGIESVTSYNIHKTPNWGETMKSQVTNNLLTAAPKETKINLNNNNTDDKLMAEVSEGEKNVYNFFVDLLKTTISVYDVKAEYDKLPPSSKNSSHVELEMDEYVAKKLNLETEKTSNKSYVVSCKSSSNFGYSIRPDNMLHSQSKFSKPYWEKLPSRTPVRKNHKSDSFHYKNSNKKALSKISSLPTPNKKGMPKRNLKRDFLNTLKEELLIRPDVLEEPQNFFEALKVIARNKKRSQKSISIENSKKPSEGDVHVCQVKRRRVLSAKSSGKRQSYSESRVTRDFYPSSSKRRAQFRSPVTTDSEMERSKQSLQVIGYDYESEKELQVYEV